MRCDHRNRRRTRRDGGRPAADRRQIPADDGPRSAGGGRWAVAALLLLLLLISQPATAQQNASYWQYSAPGRIDHLLVEDVNGDGVQEVLSAADDLNLSYIGADGRAIWDTPYRTEETITHLAAADVVPDERGWLEIIVGTEDELIVLNAARAVQWRQNLNEPVAALLPLQADDDDALEVALARASGLLQLYDDDGMELWSRQIHDNLVRNRERWLVVDDFDRDGRSDLIYGYSRDGVGEIARLDLSEGVLWRRALADGQIVHMEKVRFTVDDVPLLAVGTSTGRIELLDLANNRRLWLRSPAIDRRITGLALANMPEEQLLIAATDVGSVFAYGRDGRRRWQQTTGRPITGLAVNPESTNPNEPFTLALTLAGDQAGAASQAEILLLDSAGNLLTERYGSVSAAGLSRITDLNGDDRSELLLVDFATIELLDAGIGVGENLKDWEYQFNAEPEATLVADLDRDGEDELLIGAQDGRLHLLNPGGETEWVEELGSRIAHVAVMEEAPGGEPAVIVVHNDRQVGDDGAETFIGRLEVLQPNGQPLARWETGRAFPTTVTSLLLHDIRGDGREEIVVGTIDGKVYAYSLFGERYWETTLNGSVEFLIPVPLRDNGRQALLAGSQARQLHLFSNKGRDLIRANFFQPVVDLIPNPDAGRNGVAAYVAVADGVVRALDGGGGTIWEYDLEAIPTRALAAADGVIVTTDDERVLYVADQGDRGEMVWQLSDQGRVTALYWGDLDDDGLNDVAVGNREGQVRLFSGNGQEQWDSIELGSAVINITAMRRGPDQQRELAVVTSNGVVQHFRAQANRPPLLVRPQTDVAPGRYTVGVTTLNVEENDRVEVTLETFNPELNSWTTYETRLASGSTPLIWQLEPGELGRTSLRYRFLYDDGSNQGSFAPPAGPVPVIGGGNATWPVAGVLLALILFGGAFVYYQTRTLEARVRRFYGRVRQQPSATLQLLSVAYDMTDGSPDYLLNLASRARQDGNRPVASLADGLFLLADRPEAGLPIITGALDAIHEQWPHWHEIERWRVRFRTGEALFSAPSLTELSLLQPRLLQTAETLPNDDDEQLDLAELSPILTSIRDSERVDLVDDRLVYLNEASIQLRELANRLDWAPITVEHVFLSSIAERWSGLINAEIEGVRGQARLVATLRTRRIVPAEGAEVALEIRNQGRAPAENVQVEIVGDAAYEIVRQPEAIPFLPAGRSRQITGLITPRVNDRFRLACDIHYGDRHMLDKTVPFGDMVYLLTPQREFEPILNPYAPGTPLRRNSLVFYGREDVFQFIRDTATRQDQQNVLILVGQRRTGKTSALLRLGRHLPNQLVPVYIDCQSLGVIRGMGAFLHDIAWLISDALAERDLELPIPDLAAWEENPAMLFQREFIPHVLDLLPDDARLLLVFDEFEAFEDLVEKEILPPTLFTYLRHLMQHASGLSFVFVGTRRLEEMTTDYWSVLFNIALYRQIGFLPQDAAFRLITEPVAPHIVYDDLALDKIWRVTSGHPYFLQLVCYTLVNRANKRRTGYVTISDVNAALDEMLRLGEVHFAYMWKLSSRAERIILTTVAHHVDPETPFHPLDLVQHLEQYSIRLQPEEITTALDALVEREIMREVHAQGTALYELRIGLIGLWTARNKSLSKLYDAMRGSASGTIRRSRPDPVTGS